MFLFSLWGQTPMSHLPGNSKDGTSDIDVRVIEVTLDDGTKEYLATNLFDPLITQTMFQDLYFYRWPVETKYKELKSRLSLEEFSGATTVSVFQEFFINMLLSNLASLSQSGYSQSASLLAHNRIAASQLIRSGLYHS